MNDQLDDPANPPTESGGTQNAPGTPAEPAAAKPVDGTASNVPTQKVGDAAGPIRRPLKKRKLVPKRRPTNASGPVTGSRPAAGPRPAGVSRPGKPAQPHATHHYEKLVDEGDDESFFDKHRTKIVIGVVALLGGGIFYVLHSAKPSTATRAPEKMPMVSIPHLPPPPPPPPPPPKREPPPQKEDKMVAAPAPVEKKVDAPKPEAPKQDLGTNLKGTGAGISGLGSGSGEGGGFGGKGGGGGTAEQAFTYQIKSKVTAALKANDRTRKGNFKVQVRMWCDSMGHITRCKLDSSTGDSKLDEAIQSALNNIQLDTRPPEKVHMPIVMNLAARRP